jgi:hypothetical protein
MSEIFISYASPDKDRAELIAREFARQGWSIWWDREIPPGKSFDETIESALNLARCVVVLWSKSSVSSRWVKTEAAEGAARGVLIPALIDKVQIPLEFKRIEAADLTDWHGGSAHPEFDQLLRTVAGFVGGTAPIGGAQTSTTTENRAGRGWKSPPLYIMLTAGLIVAAIAAILMLRQNSRFERDAGVSQKREDSRTETPSQARSADSAVKPARSTGTAAPINLLAAENGGHVVVATNDRWLYAIDGDEKNWQYIDTGVVGAWAVYGFKDDRPAIFDTFKVLILGTESWNLKEFELSAGNDSATGRFEPIGKFQTQNIRFFKDPYQEFKFSPVKAKYLKVRVLSSHGFSSVGVHEFQLLGLLDTADAK